MRFLWKAGAWRLRTGCLGNCAPGSPRPAPPSHTPADGHAHLHHGGAVPLQGGQAAVQVGSPQVEEADHQGQGQLRLLPLGRHGALLGWGRGGGHHSSPCPGPGPLRGLGREGAAGRSPRAEGGGNWQAAPPSPTMHPPQASSSNHTGRGRGGPGCRKTRRETEEKETRGECEADAGETESWAPEAVQGAGPQPAPRGGCRVTGVAGGPFYPGGSANPQAARPAPHLDQELGEDVDSHGAAERDAQAEQPHEGQQGRAPQPPAHAPRALPQLPLGQQLLWGRRPALCSPAHMRTRADAVPGHARPGGTRRARPPPCRCLSQPQRAQDGAPRPCPALGPHQPAVVGLLLPAVPARGSCCSRRQMPAPPSRPLPAQPPDQHTKAPGSSLRPRRGPSARWGRQGTSQEARATQRPRARDWASKPQLPHSLAAGE